MLKILKPNKQNDKVSLTTKQPIKYSQSTPLKQESTTSKLENKSNPISSSFCVYSVPMKSWNAHSNEKDNLKVQLTHSYPTNSLKKLNIDKLSLRTVINFIFKMHYRKELRNFRVSNFYEK